MTESEKITKELFNALALFDANNTCMTVNECAKYLKVDRRTVLNRIHRGDIKAEDLGSWSIPKIQFVDKIVNESI